MDSREILRAVDHTLLAPTARWEEIRELCDDAVRYQTASVCIPASYVRQAKEYVQERMAVCTVIGFPNGYDTTASKVFQTKDALENGADEIDMVVNLGWVKDGLLDRVLDEIRAVRPHAAFTFSRSLSRLAYSPGKRKSVFARLSRNPEPISSRRPQASQRAARPSGM